VFFLNFFARVVDQVDLVAVGDFRKQKKKKNRGGAIFFVARIKKQEMRNKDFFFFFVPDFHQLHPDQPGLQRAQKIRHFFYNLCAFWPCKQCFI
jgi:hypothetical protein